jgi:hypothetical protein
MQSFVSALIPMLIIVGAGIIALLINERFAPDPLVAKIVQWVIYILMIVMIISQLLPFIR